MSDALLRDSFKDWQNTLRNRQIEIDSSRVELKCMTALARFGDVATGSQKSIAVRKEAHASVSQAFDALARPIGGEECQGVLLKLDDNDRHLTDLYRIAITYLGHKQVAAEQKAQKQVVQKPTPKRKRRR